MLSHRRPSCKSFGAQWGLTSDRGVRGICGCAEQRLQSLFFSGALPGGLHHLAAWFYGMSRTEFPRCPPLHVGSSPPSGLQSCEKPRERHDLALRGPTWLLCGAQPLKKLFLCVAAGECWCSSNLKLTRQWLRIL